jgi:hypothetical protein
MKNILICNYFLMFAIVVRFQQKQDPSMARREVMKSITNAAFGIVASTATVMTPMSNNDIAFASIAPGADQDINAIMSAVIMDSTTTAEPNIFGLLSTSPTSMYLSADTPRQLIVESKSTIQNTWFTYIDTNNFSALLSSYNSLNSPTRGAANTIVAANPTIPQLATFRSRMFNALNQVRSAAQNGNQNTCRTQTVALVSAMTSFLLYAPLP